MQTMDHTKIQKTHRFLGAAALGALVLLAAASFNGTAEARERGYVNVDFRGGHRGHDDGCDCGYRTYTQRVLVSNGYYSKVWVPPVYGTRRHGCHTYRTVVRNGYYQSVWHEPVYTVRTVRNWHTCDAHSRRGHDRHDGYGRIGFSNGRFAIGALFKF